jgi:hypothetical protein
MRTLIIKITLSIDVDEISGVAAAGAGTETRFHGWLGLMSAVDALVSVEPHPLILPAGDGGAERTGAEQ